jgi:hypothetical protein
MDSLSPSPAEANDQATLAHWAVQPRTAEPLLAAFAKGHAVSEASPLAPLALDTMPAQALAVLRGATFDRLLASSGAGSIVCSPEGYTTLSYSLADVAPPAGGTGVKALTSFLGDLVSITAAMVGVNRARIKPAFAVVLVTLPRILTVTDASWPSLAEARQAGGRVVFVVGNVRDDVLDHYSAETQTSLPVVLFAALTGQTTLGGENPSPSTAYSSSRSMQRLLATDKSRGFQPLASLEQVTTGAEFATLTSDSKGE